MSSSNSDRFLIQQIRQGDSRAWETLIARYEGRLLAFVDRRLHDRAASEDVVQETFVGFLNSLPNFDEDRELQTYLFTIASHKLTDHLRKVGRHPMKHLADSSSEGGDSSQPRAKQRAVSSLFRSQERRDLETEAVVRCLGQILSQWREKGDLTRLKVLELLWVKGWANRDVAAFLKITEQQVANFRFAAVRKLHEHIRDDGLPFDVFPELKDLPEE
jgi:RNA polymerase sigma-70 factor (ECF subfamily)